MFVRGRSAALALAALALAAACSDAGSKPVSLPSLDPSTSSSATASPTSTASDLAQVAAVVRAYYVLLNRPTTLANAAALDALMTQNCVCQQVVEATRNAVAKREHFFGRNTVVSVVPNLDGPAAADVVVTYDYTTSGLADEHGHVISSGPGRRGTTQDFRLVKREQRWLIASILRVAAGSLAR